MTTNFYSSVGQAIALLAASPYHQQFALESYLRIEIIPAIEQDLTLIYQTENGTPYALVTYAWVSAAVLYELKTTGRALRKDEWRSGETLFINDFIVPYGDIKKVMKNLCGEVFADHIAFSLRRDMDGNVRKVQRLHGKSYMRDRCRKDVA